MTLIRRGRIKTDGIKLFHRRVNTSSEPAHILHTAAAACLPQHIHIICSVSLARSLSLFYFILFFKYIGLRARADRDPTLTLEQETNKLHVYFRSAFADKYH